VHIVKSSLENMMFSGGLAIPPVLRPPNLFSTRRMLGALFMAWKRKSPSDAIFSIGLVIVYLGFVVWLYVTAPLLLAVFAVALAAISVREYGSRLLRAIAPARVRNRLMS